MSCIQTLLYNMARSRQTKDNQGRSTLPLAFSFTAKLQAGMEWLRDRWGWMVTVASFVLYFITLGVLYCYSLLFISLQEDFKSSATITGWIGSLAWAISTLTSPLTALLLTCCQTRVVALLGIVFCSSSLLISSFSPNVYLLFATFSVMYGLGINFAQHSTICLIYTYFPNKNSTRTISFALTGCQVGLLALNPLMAYFVRTIGWRSALRIFSLIVLLPGIISCVILLPPRKRSEGGDVGDPQTGQRLATHHQCKEDKNDVSNLGAREHVMPSGEEPQVEGYSPAKRAACQFCGRSEDGSGDANEIVDVEERDSMERTVVETKMSKRPDTYFFSAALMTLSLAWTFFNVNLVSYTNSVGITENHGSIILTILAGGEMVGKALLSIFGDHVPFAKVYIIVICNVLSAVISCGMIFARDFYTMIAVAASIGLMRAIFNTVPFVAGIEIFGMSHSAEASTLAMFSYGSGYLVGSVVSGGIYDLTGSYTLYLICMALVFMLSAAMFLLIPFRKRLQDFLSASCLAVRLGDKGASVTSARREPKSRSARQCSRCRFSSNAGVVYL